MIIPLNKNSIPLEGQARLSPPRTLDPLDIAVLQVNIGYRCNLSCSHCHLSAGPGRSEVMVRETMDQVLAVLAAMPSLALDITGGAPELHPLFRHLVRSARRLSRHVIVRTNLAVFSEDGHKDLPRFYADEAVEIVASLPWYLEDNVDAVRGNGVFHKSIAALRELNGLGFGVAGGRPLSLVYNPRGAVLPPPQASLEQGFRNTLAERYGISFNRLYAFANMPVGRFREALDREGRLDAYLLSLEAAYNPATLNGLMCRKLISVGWNGLLYDCDFNLAAGIPLPEGSPLHIRDFDRARLMARTIRLQRHCAGCTAGQGSS